MQPNEKHASCFILSVIPAFFSLFDTRVFVSCSSCYLALTRLCDVTP